MNYGSYISDPDNANGDKCKLSFVFLMKFLVSLSCKEWYKIETELFKGQI